MRKRLFIITFLCLFSCHDIKEVVDISGDTVNLLAPTSDAVITNAEVIFTWDALAEATGYKLQIATPSFGNASQIVTDSLVTATTFSKTLVSGNYEWRLRAENSGYQTPYFSHVFSVDLVNDPIDISNETVVITSPANNATLNTSDTIDFSWEAVQGAEEYVIEIVTPDFNNPTQTIEDTTISDTTISKSNLVSGNYQWRVKAKNTGFETNYTTQSFTIQ
jgi:predicted secreted protein